MSASGERLAGRYRIEAELGAGGMGVVYRAFDERLERAVALKVLPPERTGDGQARERMLREARAAAALGHPGIVQVFDVGETGDGGAFLVMELIRGRTLRAEVAASGRLAPARAVAVVAEIGAALDAAHAAGLVHRDVKPDNVMVREDGRVVLLDLGLVKRLAPDPTGSGALGEQSTHLTGSGVVLGTPAYLAPEQMRGESEPATDRWALGVVAYELLTGRLPWGGDSGPVLIVRIVTEDAPPASSVAELPAAVDAVLARALSKDPAARHPSAGAFATELAAALEPEASAPMGDSIAATRTTPSVPAAIRAAASGGTPPTTKRPARRVPWLGLLGVAALAVAAVIGALAGRPNPTEGRSTDTPPDPAPPPPVRNRRITANVPGGHTISLAATRDAQFVYIEDRSGIYRLLPTGERSRVTLPDGACPHLVDVFPDGRLLTRSADAVTIVEPGGAVVRRWQYAVGLATPVPRAAVSNDGRRIAFVTDRGIKVVAADGSAERWILRTTPHELLRALAWSPDGRFVALIRGSDAGSASLELHSSDGETTETVRFGGSDPNSAGLEWLDNDRLLYVAAAVDGSDEHLLMMREVQNGQLLEAREVHRWPLGQVAILRSTQDGLLHLLEQKQDDVYVAPLAADGTLSGSARRLTRSDHHDRPSGWTADGRVLFSSTRTGVWDVYVQGLSEEEPTLVAGGPTWDTWPQPFGPDHVVYFRIDVGPDGGTRRADLVQAALSGAGSPRTIRTFEIEPFVNPVGRPPPSEAGIHCSSRDRSRCAFGAQSGGRYDVQWIDVATGELEPVFATLPQAPFSIHFEPSPDGERVVGVTGSSDEVLVVERGGEQRTLDLRTEGLAQYATWLPDGRAMIVSSFTNESAALHLVPLEGEPREILQATDAVYWLAQPSVSPDGRQLAYLAKEVRADVWLLEGLR